MKRIDEIVRELRRMTPTLRHRYAIREIGVFGSYVRGEQTAKSDLDVLVEFDDRVTLIDFAGLQQDLSDALGMNVDLVMRSALKPRIGQRILAELVRI
jgi:predicted nucleotidyltransferase